jgi:phage baseplate assembly protein W
MKDASGNTGTWTFTLSVTQVLAPQSAVTPTQPTSPAGIEIKVPFQIDPSTGGVVILTNYNDIIAQHVLTALMTAPGERVMNPNYGVGLETKVFEPIYARNSAVLQQDVQSLLQATEPSVQINSIVVAQDPNYANVLDVTISYSVLPSNAVNTLSLAVGGGISQVVSP